MTGLPPELRRAVDDVVARAGLDEDAARAVRADLERHLMDGLAAGRTPQELLARFGDADAVAPLLARAPVPPSGPVDRSTSPFWSDVRADLRHALRGFARTPMLGVACVVVLALGIGTNLIVSSVVNALLLRPLPVEDPTTLVDVWADVEGGNSFAGFSWDDAAAYRDEASGLSDLAAYSGLRVVLGPEEGGPTVTAQVVSSTYFPMLGLRPWLGRLDLPPDDASGAEAVGVVSHRMWRGAFGADPDLIGRTIIVDGRPVTVVGVAPAGFSGHFIGFPVDVWLPLATADRFLPGFDPHDPSDKRFEMIGRLRAGVPLAAVRTDLNGVAARLAVRHPETNRGHRVGVTPTTGLDHSLSAGVRTFAGLLSAVSLMVLLIACMNVGGMLLVRTMGRERELAVRTALGAGRVRLLRQLLTESGVLVVAATLLGLAAGTRATTWLEGLLPAISGGLRLDLPLDGRVVGLTALAAAGAVVLAAAAPSLHLLRRDPADSLRARGGSAVGAARVRGALVALQVGASVVLVTVTGLFLRALLDGERVTPGFEPDRIASFSLRLDDAALGGIAADAALRTLLADLAALPGLDGVTASDQPVVGWVRTPMELEVAGALPPAGQDRLTVDVRRVGPGYFGTVGIPLRSGRDLLTSDEGAGVPAVVVNHAFVRRYWPEGPAVGRSLRIGGTEARVVGVAEDARYIVQDPEPDPLVHLPLDPAGRGQVQIVLAGDRPGERLAEVRAVLARALPGHPAPDPRTARQILRDFLLPQRIGAGLVGIMGTGALMLAALGLYGLVRYAVARDAHALGIRMALGSSRARVVGGVIRSGALPVGVGMVGGLVVAAATAPLLGGLLPGVRPHDPLIYGSVALVFVVVTGVASALPARRATRIQPADVLREA